MYAPRRLNGGFESASVVMYTTASWMKTASNSRPGGACHVSLNVLALRVDRAAQLRLRR
jgi:hypothetical protein